MLYLGSWCPDWIMLKQPHGGGVGVMQVSGGRVSCERIARESALGRKEGEERKS